MCFLEIQPILSNCFTLGHKQDGNSQHQKVSAHCASRRGNLVAIAGAAAAAACGGTLRFGGHLHAAMGQGHVLHQVGSQVIHEIAVPLPCNCQEIRWAMAISLQSHEFMRGS